MHSFRTLGVLLVTCIAGACDPGAPNGKNQVLFFQPEYAGRIAENLTATIVIPSHVTLGDRPKSVDRIENYDFAFDGTTLQFPETSGLTILDTTLDATGWNIKFKCSAAPAKPATLTVDVVDGTATKYSDSTQVTCNEGSKLVVTDQNGAHVGSTDPSFDYPHYIVGAITNVVRVDLLDSGGSYLSGHGMTGVNVTVFDGISSDTQLSTSVFISGESPGQAGILIGDTIYDLPFDVVSDDAWSYALSAPVDHGSGPIWGINALLADGTVEPVGSQCQITVTDATGTQLISSTGACYVPTQTGHGQVCITTRNKSGCVSY
jgi:hypothetical protein